MDTTNDEGADAPQDAPEWTYPLRTCRMCLEEVPATVTMYPPGLPARFQTPQVEYKNSDEYGKLLRPCMCKGGMRYIHELCLLQSRFKGGRASSEWQCPTCFHKFSFRRIRAKHILEGRIANVAITIFVLLVLIFVLGFVADPLINLYADPVETIRHSDYWDQIDLNDMEEPSSWTAHFTKGFVTMGLLGYLKTWLANPLNWWYMRGMVTGGRTRTGNTGQERVLNISWIAIVVGIATAFYFFYQWVQSLVGGTLHRLGNRIVDTQLPGDDDDIKPPPGYQHKTEGANADAAKAEESEDQAVGGEKRVDDQVAAAGFEENANNTPTPTLEDNPSTGRSSGIDTSTSRGRSFWGT